MISARLWRMMFKTERGGPLSVDAMQYTRFAFSNWNS